VTATSAAAVEATQLVAKTLQTAYEALLSTLVTAGIPIESAIAIATAGIVITARTLAFTQSGLTRSTPSAGSTHSAPGDGLTTSDPASGTTTTDGTDGETHLQPRRFLS
jgi:hypothetical protein